MSDGEIQVVLVKVKGDQQTVCAALDRFTETIRQQFSSTDARPIEINPPPSAADVAVELKRAQKRSKKRVADVVASVRRKAEDLGVNLGSNESDTAQKPAKRPAVGKGHDRVPYAGPPLSCPECGRPCANPRGLGKHRAAAHGVKGGFSRSTKADKPPANEQPNMRGMFECTECDLAFHTAGSRDRHIENDHPEAA